MSVHANKLSRIWVFTGESLAAFGNPRYYLQKRKPPNKWRHGIYNLVFYWKLEGFRNVKSDHCEHVER